MADPTPSPTLRPLPPRLPPLLLTGRLLLLVLAAVAVVGAFTWVGAPESGGATVRYRCPMHHEAVATAPGSCPICGMALVADEPGPTPSAADDVEATRLGRAERRSIAETARVPAWADASGVVAVLYRDDLIGLAAGDAATFYPATEPARGIEVRRTDAPAEDHDRATVAVRFEAGPDAPAAGAEGWLVVPARPRDLLVVPATAVLEAADGPYVVLRGPGGFARRSVRTGRPYRGVVAVLDGLTAGDEVVVTGTFLVDAELGRGRVP